MSILKRRNFEREDSFYQDDSGAVLMILALIVAGIGGFVILLAIDSVMVKVASTELREKTEVICRQVARNPVIQRTAAEVFRGEVDQMAMRGLPRYSTITDAALIVPTMPENGYFSMPAGNSGTGGSGTSVPNNGTFVPDAEPSPNQPYIDSNSLSNLLPAGCSTPGDCVFVGDVKPSNINTRYPVTVWNNVRDSGNGVACEVNAEVSGTLMPFFKKRIVGRSMWWRPPRGKMPVFDPNDPIGSSPGFTLAIAPEMSTNSHEPRFRFSDKFSSEFRIKYDPLYGFDIAATPIDAFSSAPATVAQNIDGVPLAIPRFPSADFRWFSLSATSNIARTAGGYTTKTGAPFVLYNGTDSLVTSDREEMLTACENPAVAARNAFVTTILELAERHGQLRKMTEVLLVNPKHRVGNNLNFPVQITTFGQDIALKLYQIPYTFWDTGSGSDGLIHKEGPLNPFTDSPLSSDWQQHHALVAGQLRSCYHMYRSTANTALNRLDIRNITYLNNNSNFEPDVFAYSPSLREATYRPGDLWDQENPDTFPSGTFSQSRQLSAVEVGASLGTIQDCPYEENSPIFPETSNGNYPSGLHLCQKPPTMCTDTGPKPDIVGLLHYIARTQPSGAGGTSYLSDKHGGPAVPAITGSGIYPIKDANGPLYFEPSSVGTVHYTLTSNLNSNVMIVMHRALDTADIPKIKDIVTTQFRDRPITVVFFPISAVESEPQVLANLNEAFDVGANSRNTVHIFSPYHKDYYFAPPGTSTSTSSSTSSSTTTSSSTSSTTTTSSTSSTGSTSTSASSSTTTSASSSTSGSPPTSSSSTTTSASSSSSTTTTSSSSSSTSGLPVSSSSTSGSLGSSSSTGGIPDMGTGAPLARLEWPAPEEIDAAPNNLQIFDNSAYGGPAGGTSSGAGPTGSTGGPSGSTGGLSGSTGGANSSPIYDGYGNPNLGGFYPYSSSGTTSTSSGATDYKNPRNGSSTSSGGSFTWNQDAWEAYQDYWNFLLTNDDVHNHGGQTAVLAAGNLFIQRVIRYQIKF